ncbi:uncharacterized protein LOC117176307 [Belonocnema kinseyi]|uniref:uncharacterized protein LOC117176307 n=1 Tax=Belonocnema kinseyi TaxID=2817044 RepID=UPI00143DD31C|nr:uncharacterized protein LOC117176307 [Belonocnema kinseyi]
MTMKHITDEVDIRSKLGTEECLFAFGLSVMPSFRGQSFGENMLDSRKDICQKYGLKGTATIFTSPVSIKLAERLGFEVLKQCAKGQTNLMIPSNVTLLIDYNENNTVDYTEATMTTTTGTQRSKFIFSHSVCRKTSRLHKIRKT